MVYEFSLVCAGGAAMTAAGLVNTLVSASGGLRTPAPFGLTLLGGFQSPRLTVRNLLSVFGADPGGSGPLFAGSPGGIPSYPRSDLEMAFAVVHLAGVALVAVAVVLAARSLWRSLSSRVAVEQDFVVDLLVVSIVVNVVMVVCLYYAFDLYRAEETVPILPLGAALAGRLLGAPLARITRNDPSRDHRGRRIRRVVVPSLATVAACYCAMLGYAAAQPQLPPASAALSRWLAAHRLHDGLAGFWEAASVTLDTGGANVMRPLVPNALGQVAPYSWEADIRQFNPASNSARFLVLSHGHIPDERQAIATFGRPTETYRYQDYTIMVWRKNLLRELPPAVVRPGER
jgi:hypothetical protein